MSGGGTSGSVEPGREILLDHLTVDFEKQKYWARLSGILAEFKLGSTYNWNAGWPDRGQRGRC